MGFWGNMVDRIAGSLCSNEIKELLQLKFIPKVDLGDVTQLKPITGLLPNPKKPKSDPVPGVQNLLNPLGF